MLHYRTHGSPQEPAVCFLHGFMGSSADWAPLVEALSPDAFCVSVDLPGHGESLGLARHEYTMEGATQSLADVLDDLGIEQCSLVGYSMGGRAALYFSLFHPRRVHRLVLESASPGLETEEERADRRRVDNERARRITEDFDSFLQDWYRMSLFDSLRRHDLVDEMVATRRRNDPAELSRALRGLGPGQQPSLWNRLDDLDTPTLLLTGALDEKYDGITARVARTAPAARRTLVPGAGHNVHAERPQAFLAHLVGFLTHN